MFEQQITIGMGQADAAGVIFAPRLLELTHGVYEAFLASHGWSIRRILDEGWGLPLIHLEADFLQPLKLSDRVVASLATERLGDSSFTLACRYHKSGELAALTRSVHVAVEAGGKRPLPASFREMLSTLSPPPPAA